MPVLGSIRLQSGTMLLGGHFRMPIEYNYQHQSSLKLDFGPEFAYFVLQGFSVGGRVGLAYTPLDASTAPRAPVLWDASVLVKYYYEMVDNLYLFTGLDLGLSDNEFVLVELRWSLGFPLGVLWAVNEHVGLVFGAPVKVQFKTTSFFEKVVVTPGYFGLVGFF